MDTRDVARLLQAAHNLKVNELQQQMASAEAASLTRPHAILLVVNPEAWTDEVQSRIAASSHDRAMLSSVRQSVQHPSWATIARRCYSLASDDEIRSADAHLKTYNCQRCIAIATALFANMAKRIEGLHLPTPLSVRTSITQPVSLVDELSEGVDLTVSEVDAKLVISVRSKDRSLTGTLLGVVVFGTTGAQAARGFLLPRETEPGVISAAAEFDLTTLDPLVQGDCELNVFSLDASALVNTDRDEVLAMIERDLTDERANKAWDKWLASAIGAEDDLNDESRALLADIKEQRHVPANPVPAFSHGDIVRNRTQRDRIGSVVGEPRRVSGEFWYDIQFGAERRRMAESALEAHSAGMDIYELLAQGSFGNKSTFSKCVTFTKLKHPLRDTLYSFRATRTQFFPYQFKPLIKLLNSPTQRLLIADEVGLGKTIETGFILRELQSRQDLRRVLIVCPSKLCTKWKDELARRFDEEFRILDAAGVREFLTEFERKGDRAALRGICSLQTIRGKQILEAFEALAPPLDLAVVDEAHYLRNRETLSFKAGKVISECADAMVMLTATPVHLGNENLFNLLNILDEEGFNRLDVFDRQLEANELVLTAERILRAERNTGRAKAALRLVEATSERGRFLKNPYYQITLDKLDRCDANRRDELVDLQQDFSQLNLLGHILTRTRKREVQMKRPKRTPHIVPVEFASDEQAFYEQTTDLCASWYQRMSGDWAARFAVISLQRQMASSIPAFLDRYLDATEIVVADDEDESQAKESSDLAVEDWAPSSSNGGLGPATAILEAPPAIVRRSTVRSERTTTKTGAYGLRADPDFRDLLNSYEHLRETDSKYDAFRDELQQLEAVEAKRKVLVFSYFKGTLKYLERRLRDDGFSCLLLTGDVPSNPANPDEDERGRRIRAFREDPTVQILLSSEVGSEGLDFQFCHLLFNYDLPWNPMVVEQRIGRLDRIGQESDRIIICNLSVKGTIEQRILDRLYNRIHIFEESIGDLEPILGEEIQRLTDDLLSRDLTSQEQDSLIEERAEALERQRLHSVTLERESSRFLGHDEFFNEEIGRVTTLRRYVTADEMRVFVTDFLQVEHPRCTLQDAKQHGCFWLTVSAELRDFLRRYNSPTDPALVDLLARVHGGGLLVAFDAEVAYANSDADLCHSQHPLVKAIRAFYDEHADRVHPVARVKVASSSAEKADYLYFVNLLEVSGARPGKYQEAIFVPVDGTEPLSRDQSEQLLAEMIVTGEDLDVELELPSEILADLRNAADDELGRRLTERRTELVRANDALVESRLASLSASYEAKRAKKEDLLRRAESHSRKESYIRMLSGSLRNIEGDYQERRRRVEECRNVAIQVYGFAAGIVRVV
jgi:hypothetical protein